MMGRQERGQGQFFYRFDLDSAQTRPSCKNQPSFATQSGSSGHAPRSTRTAFRAIDPQRHFQTTDLDTLFHLEDDGVRSLLGRDHGYRELAAEPWPWSI
jgi:hypothetical protein